MEQFDGEIHKFNKLLKDADRELYPGCRKFPTPSFILHLYHIKCTFGWCNQSFGALLKVLKDAFPEGESLPNFFNETKKIIEGLRLNYGKIYAYPNDCMLF